MNENRPSASTITDNHRIDSDSSNPTPKLEIKEEPMEEEKTTLESLNHDSCFVEPKPKKIDNFIEPKQEENGHFLEPKLEEIDDFIEPKLEELEYFYTEQSEIKLELVESIKAVKEEIQEPKLEEPDYPVLSGPNVGPSKLEEPEIDRPSNSIPTDYIKLEELDRSSPASLTPCVICSDTQSPMKQTTPDEEVIILTACLLRNELSFEAAELMIAGCNTKTMCTSHFLSAIDTIFLYFGVTSIHKIPFSPSGLSQNLISMVNMLSPGVDHHQFMRMLREFQATIVGEGETQKVVRTVVKKRKPSPSFKKPRPPPVITHPDHRQCSACALFIPNQNAIITQSRYAKIVLEVGLHLSGKQSDYQLESTGTRSRICRNHFSKALDEIYKVLKFKNDDEMQSCPMDNVEQLMITVNSIFPKMIFIEFSNILEEGLRGLDLAPQTGVIMELLKNPAYQDLEFPSKQPIQYQKRRKCSLCSTHQFNRETSSITMLKRKLMLMVGQVLGSKKTMEAAQHLMSEYQLNICKIHLSEAIDEIFKCLNIDKSDDIKLCSNDNVTQLMLIVNVLYPDITFREFFHYVKQKT